MKLGQTAVILLAVVLTATVIYGGCYGMSKYIVHCKTCERFNIDNFELRTHTDIKNTRDVWCYYDEHTRTKTSVFYMDIKGEELSNYIGFSGFSKVYGAPLHFVTMKAWDDSLRNIAISNLYYKKGSYKKDSWLLLLDSSTATLWAEIIEAP